MRPPLLYRCLKRQKSTPKAIQYSELVKVFQGICHSSIIERSEHSASWDLDRSLSLLEEHSLHENITFVHRRFTELPLNSERHMYETNNIVIRDLHIHLDARDGLTAHNDWHPLSYAKWHFENCCFEPASPNMWSLSFPWRGSFRFYRNRFDFKTSRVDGNWLFSFGVGSRMVFESNDFKKSHIQTECTTPASTKDTDDKSTSVVPLSHLSLVGNRGIKDWVVLEGYSSASFTGMNRMDRLWFIDLQNKEPNHNMAIYLGPREKIDQNFHHYMHHRRLFVRLKNLAATRHDTRQIRILEKQLDRIEYFLNKERVTPSLLDFWTWIEYWQDRVLYAWRRWSSDFYRSWLRPLAMIVLGYLTLNAAPALFLDDFSLSNWVAFSLRPISDLAKYAETLKSMLPADYRSLSLGRVNVLRFLGLFEVVWVAMWSFAFARAIRK